MTDDTPKDRPGPPEATPEKPSPDVPSAADLPEEESFAVTTLEDVEPPDVDRLSAEFEVRRPSRDETDEKPADDKPADKPADDKPADKPADDKPAKKPVKKPAKKKKAKKPAREIPDLPKAMLRSSPHKVGTDSVPRVMFTVVLALLPAAGAAVWFFGWRAAAIIAGCAALCVGLDFAFARLRMPTDRAWKTAIDGSALITGILLAFNLPVSSPWWLVLVGCIVAMALGKHSFGGLGQNPFNPALVARVFLLLSFPAQMTTWDAPIDRLGQAAAEAVTGASPLGVITENVKAATEDGPAVTVEQALAAADVDLWKLSLGNVKGSLGEVSVIALLLGAVLMMVRRVITWHIPVSYVGTVAAITGLMYVVSPDQYASPLFHVVSGGLILGAFYMATDMVTSPVTARGMLIFGAGCGLITAAIRLFGAFPEGVSFAILIMNGFVPLIERKTRPRKFGELKPRKEANAHG